MHDLSGLVDKYVVHSMEEGSYAWSKIYGAYVHGARVRLLVVGRDEMPRYMDLAEDEDDLFILNTHSLATAKIEDLEPSP